MPSKKLSIDNWVIQKKDGTLARFSTYSLAAKDKRENPLIYSRTSDIRYAPDKG